MISAAAPGEGTLLDKYELLEKVGEGGMAQVYRGRHTALGRIVAVKVLHPHLSATERNRLRFEREARAIETLNHDHILKIFDYSGRASSTCYIVTEFIEGHTLKDILNAHGNLPSELAAIVGLALCDALTYAHARGIVHRDIKPENVMIRHDGVVKLMDFGIARVLDESSMTLTGGLVGSPAYMSPEQASDAEVDARSDLFSLGTLLYRSVTGHLPFQGSNAPVILRNILEGHYVDPQDLEPGLSPRLVAVMVKALQTAPADRFQTAAELARSLQEVLEESDVPNSALELTRFLDDPAAYRAQLTAHLSRHLPEVSRHLIARGDTVPAMKLLNRVLYLDEHNEAVQTLIQSLYRSEPPLLRTVAAGGGLLAVALIVSVWLGLGPLAPISPPLDPPSLAGPGGVAPGTGQPPRSAAAGTGTLTAPATGVSTPGDPATAPTPSVPEASRLPTSDLAEQSLPAGAQRPSRQVETRPLEPGTKRTGTGTARPPAARPPTLRASSLPSEQSAQTEPPPPRAERRAPLAEAEDAGQSVASASLEGLVQIRTNYQADIFVDDVPLGNTMLRRDPIPLSPGKHRLKLVNRLCAPFETQLEVKSGEILEPSYTLVPLPARVVLQNLPPGAQVLLEGQEVSASEPDGVPVTALRRELSLEIRTPDGQTARHRIPPLNPADTHVLDVRAGSTEAASP